MFINNEIQQLSNEKLKKIRSYYIKKYRERYSKAVVEGVNSVETVVNKFPELIDEIVINQELFEENTVGVSVWKKRILRIVKVCQKNNIKISQTSAKILSSITANSEGVLAIVQTKTVAKNSGELNKKDSLVLVCKETSDPGNAGTIIRTAVAFGVSKIIFTGNHVDHWNPKLIRASVGAVFQIEIMSIETVKETVEFLESSGYQTIMADGVGLKNKPAIGLKEFMKTSQQNKHLAIMFGNEAHGFSDYELNLGQNIVKIETSPNSVESLNLASAVAIVLYEMKL